MKKVIIASVISAFMLASCGKQTEEIKPVRKNITEMVFASGMLEASGTYSLTAGTEGYISELGIIENEVIKQGQILGRIDNKENSINEESGKILFEIAKSNTSPDSPQLVQARNELEAAKHKMEYDLNLLNRYKKMLEAKSIPAAEYEKAELQYSISARDYQSALQNYDLVKQQAERQLVINRAQKEINETILANNKIYAHKPGRVLKKYKQPGDFVRKGEVIAVIGDADNIYAKVNVDEGSISKVRPGQEAFIRLNTEKEKVYKGEVTEILPSFEESSQSFICRISFTEAPDFKITGTQLQANIVVGEEKNALLIPRKYLGFGNEVMVKGESVPRKIKTGIVSSQWVEVLGGISGNTTLITENLR